MESVKEDNKKEEKYYVNLIFCKLSIGVIFTFVYIFANISLTLINRLIFQKFNFKFNFTLLFLQQLFCCIFFTFLGNTNETFRSKSGEISFKDFNKLKYQYVIFCFIFMANTLSSFIGNQLVLNTAMFLTLRKFVPVMNYIYDLFINKKDLPSYFGISVTLITLGTLLTGIDDFTADFLGYFVVFINNTVSVFFGQVSEKFKKQNGVSNLKLLIYCSYLATPILFFIIIFSGEFSRLIVFFKLQQEKSSYFIIQFAIIILINFLLCAILNSSFFLSNETNSSLFTQLLSNCKDIFISLFSLFILRDFKPTFKTLFGLIISTSGAMLFSIKSIMENIQFDKKEKKTA